MSRFVDLMLCCVVVLVVCCFAVLVGDVGCLLQLILLIGLDFI